MIRYVIRDYTEAITVTVNSRGGRREKVFWRFFESFLVWWFWLILDSFCRFWLVLGICGWFQGIVTDFECLRLVLGSCGWLCVLQLVTLNLLISHGIKWRTKLKLKVSWTLVKVLSSIKNGWHIILCNLL